MVYSRNGMETNRMAVRPSSNIRNSPSTAHIGSTSTNHSFHCAIATTSPFYCTLPRRTHARDPPCVSVTPIFSSTNDVVISSSLNWLTSLQKWIVARKNMMIVASLQSCVEILTLFPIVRCTILFAPVNFVIKVFTSILCQDS